MPKKINQESVAKEISLSEFFEKNRHILGFDSPQKALFMIVKEALDNSLDACEEAEILPDVSVSVTKNEAEEYEVTISDNGPGIERKDIPNVFGKLLYGSRFHSYRQSRGQQGIGITAAVLFGQITTGKHSEIITKRKDSEVAYRVKMGINIKENVADVILEEPMIWDREHGTYIKIITGAKYQTGKQSVFEYLKETAAVNPNMELTFTDPDGKVTVFKRVLDEPSKRAVAIKPYPIGLEIGEINSIAKSSTAESLKTFLSGEFSRISSNLAAEILQVTGLDGGTSPQNLSPAEMKKLKEGFESVKIMPPQTDCLSPLGETFIRKGLMNVYGELRPSFYSKPIIRKPAIYNGNPFAVEAGLVYGGDIPSDSQIRIVRYANKVPLLYQQGACAITKAIQETDWRNYGLDQRSGQGIPYGPAMLFIHVYGVKLPYTSESKEAIAPVPEILEEVKAALKVAGREIRRHLRKKDKRKKADEKFRLVNQIIPEIAKKASSILSENEPVIDSVLSQIANVVFVNETVASAENSVEITCTVHNYTKKARSFSLFADPPVGEIEGDNQFEITNLESGEFTEFKYRIIGASSNYPGTSYYFKGIDPVNVLGAELLPADWGMKGVEMEESDQ